MSKVTSFKRLNIGSVFVSRSGDSDGIKFRKASKSGAFKMKDNGRGETHAEVSFTRSHAVVPC